MSPVLYPRIFFLDDWHYIYLRCKPLNSTKKCNTFCCKRVPVHFVLCYAFRNRHLRSNNWYAIVCFDKEIWAKMPFKYRRVPKIAMLNEKKPLSEM